MCNVYVYATRLLSIVCLECALQEHMFNIVAVVVVLLVVLCGVRLLLLLNYDLSRVIKTEFPYTLWSLVVMREDAL